MNETITITYDLVEILKRIEDKIDSNHKELSQKIDKQSEEIGTIKVELAEFKTELKGMNKRLDYQEFINRGVLIGLIIALLGGLAKLFGFVGKS